MKSVPAIMTTMHINTPSAANTQQPASTKKCSEYTLQVHQPGATAKCDAATSTLACYVMASF